MTTAWPKLDYVSWRDTCSALHLYLQIIGKYRVARSPWVNHSWHATFYVNARGLTTSMIPDQPGGTEVLIDLIDHAVIGTATNGRTARFALEPMSVAEFHGRFQNLVGMLGGTPRMNGRPNEIVDALPFAEDVVRRPYDRDAASRFFQALVPIDAVFKRFRTRFIGKCSPVHLFWGAVDLAVTRFSGRLAPMHPGGVPNLPDEVTREAYSHEVSSAGFWPGGGSHVDYPAFYSYAYPAPDGFSHAAVEPADAFYDERLGEFLLPYEAVRVAPDPEAALLAFLQSSYEAAAKLGRWDREALERPRSER